MGIYRRFVKSSLELADPDVEPSKRLATIPNAITISRPTVLAGMAVKKLLSGEKGVTPWIMAVGASDAEGSVGRIIDRAFPKLGIGNSESGKRLDPIADTIAIIEVGGAALLSKRVHPVAKLAIATALGQEGLKSAWALRKNSQYKKATGTPLEIPPSEEGKEAMIEKLMGITLAVSTHDLDNPGARMAMSLAALGHAVSGSKRGHQEIPKYNQLADQLMSGSLNHGEVSDFTAVSPVHSK